MSQDLQVDETNDIQLDPDTGDFIMTDDSDLTEATRIALGTNAGELEWNTGFGLDHLNLLSMIDNEPAMEAEISDYLEAQFDNFVSAEITSMTRKQRVATISLKVIYSDDNGNETTAETETEVETNGNE